MVHPQMLPGVTSSTVLRCGEQVKLSYEQLRGRHFRFERADGSVVNSHVCLDREGIVGGHSNDNEAHWSIEDGILVFTDCKGNVTTRFTDLQSIVPLEISGAFLPNHHTKPWHRLIEIPAATGALTFDRERRRHRCAVLVRSHVIDDKFFELYNTLARGAHGYDLFAALDDTHGRPTQVVNNAIWHSRQRCPDIGLRHQHPNLLWQCGDFPFYFALREVGDYEYYIMLEFDVHLLSGSASFAASLVRKLEHAAVGGIDMLGLGLDKSGTGWMWFEAARASYKDVWCMYYPFVVLSRRAVMYMYSQRQLEAIGQPNAADIMHCEAFTASSLQAGGFNCFDLNDFMPGAYSRPLMSLPGGGYMGQEFDVPNGLQMVHPVYTPRSYLERLIRHVRDGKMTAAGFGQLLGSKQCQNLPVDIKKEFLNIAEAVGGDR
jgi:hypothetical protein